MNLLALFWTLILLAVLISIFLTAAARAKARLKKQYPPSGQMIDIGGYRLHMHVEGKGTFMRMLATEHSLRGRYEWALSVISTCKLFIRRYAQILKFTNPDNLRNLWTTSNKV